MVHIICHMHRNIEAVSDNPYPDLSDMASIIQGRRVRYHHTTAWDQYPKSYVMQTYNGGCLRLPTDETIHCLFKNHFSYFFLKIIIFFSRLSIRPTLFRFEPATRTTAYLLSAAPLKHIPVSWILGKIYTLLKIRAIQFGRIMPVGKEKDSVATKGS